LRQKQSQEKIGQKCIDYLGNPRTQGDNQQKGMQGEVIATYKLARLGYDVRHENPCNYDLTVHGDNGITRIQVKTFNDAWRHNSTYYQRVNLLKSGKSFAKLPYLLTDFDFLAAVDIETEEVFLVPIRDLESPSNPGKTKQGVTRETISSYKI